MYSEVRIGKHLYAKFSIQNGLKLDGTKTTWNTTAAGLCRWCESTGSSHTIKKNTNFKIDSRKEVGLEVSAEKN
jgi:hypothetical protein